MLNLFHPISMSERKVFVTTSDLHNNIKQYEYIIYDTLYMEGDKLGFLSFKSRCGRTVDEIRLKCPGPYDKYTYIASTTKRARTFHFHLLRTVITFISFHSPAFSGLRLGLIEFLQ